MIKKIVSYLLVMGIILTTLGFNQVSLSAQDVSDDNLALNKPVTASNQNPSFPSSNLTDANEDSRWSAETPAPGWAYVDLQETLNINHIAIKWESKSNRASDYELYVTDDVEEWGEPILSIKDNQEAISIHDFDTISGRYVKFVVTKIYGYPNVSASDLKVKFIDPDAGVEQDPRQNVAFGSSVTTSSNEAASLSGANLVDGDTKSRTSRWSSNLGAGPHWVILDLGEIRDIQNIKLYWELRKALGYSLEISNDIGEGAQWQSIYTTDKRPTALNESVELKDKVRGRYLRLYIPKITAEDPDGGITWNTISLFEIEVFGGIFTPEISPEDAVVIHSVEKGDTHITYDIPEGTAYEIIYNGTDFEHVIDTDGKIYQPLVDTTVVANFKFTNKSKPKDYFFKEINVLVPGQLEVLDSDNPAPKVLPELAEWKGSTGTFKVGSSTRLVVSDPKLKATAQVFAEDYEDLFNVKLAVVEAAQANPGDILFTLTTDTSKGLKKEGSLLTITDKIIIEAEDPTGAYWATRSILQSIKHDGHINQGVARDYPMHEVRGFILDVGRKTFKLDFLQDVVKEMSWYKMNDFQIHLNDNLIPLEYYSQKGWDPMEAYSGFRLESDIKEGGNGGLNKADLTSIDVFYTKTEFKDLITHSRVRGVNIVPEIDTPAHSLALTKVRPDLRLGLWGRDNDHLDLTKQFEASIGFVQSIFDEYMGAGLSNPTFDQDTIIHVGADEFNANHEAYRRFSDEMLEYVQDTNRKARIWGSLSTSKGVTPVRSKGVQMNLWNFGYANFDAMYEDGFELINTNDGHYYIVPNAGYYYDYLNNGVLYNLPINEIGGIRIPNGDEQMVGGAFAVWNDMTDYLDNGISEYDVLDRIQSAIPLFGSKLWGKQDLSVDGALQRSKTLGNAPQTNFHYEVESKEDSIAHYTFDKLKDSTQNNNHLVELTQATLAAKDGKTILNLETANSYATTPLETIGLGSDLRVKVKRLDGSLRDQILFESDYGSIKAVQATSGKVGLTRENYDYSFNYTLPVGDWVELEFKNEFRKIALYVNGELVDTLGDGEQVEGRPLHATNMFAFNTIGSQSNSFIGFIDDVRVGVNASFNSTMEMDHLLWNLQSVQKPGDNKDAIQTAQAVINSYAPSASDIAEQIEIITELINSYDFEIADYSRVDVYTNLIPEDLSRFTAASVASLESTIASIRKDLPISLQDTVDAYEIALGKALNNLELKAQQSLTLVPNSQLAATASSQQSGGEGANKVLDDNPSTVWHTKYDITTLPHWLNLEIRDASEVSSLLYLPRQSGQNGRITKYEVHTSMDGTNFTKVTEGNLVSSAAEVEIKFDPVMAKHVRLIITGSVGNFGSIAELKLKYANVVADVAGLEALFNSAKAIKDAGFTEETWTQLQDVIEEIGTFLKTEVTDANQVEGFKHELLQAVVSLQLKSHTVNKDILEIAINDAEKINLDLYTDFTTDIFKASLSNSIRIFENLSSTQKEVDTAVIDLKAAIQQLEKKPVVPGLDFSDLEALIKKAEAINTDEFTADSAEILKQVLTELKESLENISTQEEIDLAEQELQEAIDQLVKKDDGEQPVIPEEPGEGEGEGKPVVPVDPGPGKPLPPTGVAASTTMLWSIALLAVGLFIIRKSRRNKSNGI